MSKYKEAAQHYDSMITAFKRFDSGRDRGYNHSMIICEAINLAKLDLPNPWTNMEDEPEEHKVKVEEPKAEEVKAEVVEPASEHVKPADKSYKHFDFKRK